MGAPILATWPSSERLKPRRPLLPNASRVVTVAETLLQSRHKASAADFPQVEVDSQPLVSAISSDQFALHTLRSTKLILLFANLASTILFTARFAAPSGSFLAWIVLSSPMSYL